MHQNKNQNNQLHVPVLLDEVITYLAPEPEDSYLDLTAGYGGHASAIISHTHAPDRAVLVDRDENAVQELRTVFQGSSPRIMNDDFYTASQQLVDDGLQFDMILADLGVSSPHLNQANRGFMFSESGPLDMRMDRRQLLTAEIMVNTYSESELTDILKHYGEEPKAKQIAHAIAEARPLSTTSELAEIVARQWPGYSKTHPATRTFQALRIAVNDELGLLERTLPNMLRLLNPGGHLAIISFHSLEDRLVKRYLADIAGDRYDAELRLLTKRPVVAGPNEIVTNPRARSAKLRAAVKNK
ncbi:MAG: rRNA ((1402)-N(4))-methyltransferase RsmH [Candidatus Saccharibacteria bacterium]|nr:rRNA ((1402)-N(4))-methyltransferase RsmH [Candidatus Saccharibacteria bacterium]